MATMVIAHEGDGKLNLYYSFWDQNWTSDYEKVDMDSTIFDIMDRLESYTESEMTRVEVRPMPCLYWYGIGRHFIVGKRYAGSVWCNIIKREYRD